MNLIRIGEMFLNLDTVTRIVPVVGGMPGELRVFFAHDDCREFDGDDADILRAWLTKNALDISTQQPSTSALSAAAPALFDALRMVERAKRTHPDRDGASHWAILLTPRQLATIRAAIDAATATGSYKGVLHTPTKGTTVNHEQPDPMGTEGIEARRTRLGPARNTAEQLCYINPKVIVHARQRERGFGGAAPEKKSFPTSQIR